MFIWLDIAQGCRVPLDNHPSHKQMSTVVVVPFRLAVGYRVGYHGAAADPESRTTGGLPSTDTLDFKSVELTPVSYPLRALIRSAYGVDRMGFMPGGRLEELERQRKRQFKQKLRKHRDGLLEDLEAWERSETKMAEWQKERRLKQSLRDNRNGLPFVQFPSLLVSSGILAKLKASSLRVYLALISKSHNTKRTTLIGVGTVAKLTGLSEFSIVKSYAELKGFGLISRRRIRNGPYRPYLTTICPPSEWVLPTSNSCL